MSKADILARSLSRPDVRRMSASLPHSILIHPEQAEAQGMTQQQSGVAGSSPCVAASE